MKGTRNYERVTCPQFTPVLFSFSRFLNRPFPSSKKSYFQSEAKCEAIDMKMIFNYDANKTHFHNNGFALNLVLKVRFFGTRKWPIRGPDYPGAWNRLPQNESLNNVISAAAFIIVIVYLPTSQFITISFFFSTKIQQRPVCFTFTD